MGRSIFFLFFISFHASAAERCGVTSSLRLIHDIEHGPRFSRVDGTPVIRIHEFIRGIEKQPRWKPLAEKIKELREAYAPRLNERRNLYNSQRFDPDFKGRSPGYGYERMKESATKQPGKTIEEAFNKFHPGQEYVLKDEGSKIIITPKNKLLGKEYVEILYDVSGNYFRLQKGKHTGGEFLEFLGKNKRYTDWSGNIINTGNLKNDPQKFHELMDSSHWNALIE
jgi:hypothetical protein